MNQKITTISFSEIIRFVWRYFRRFYGLVILAYLAITVSILSELASPILLGWLVDTITSGKTEPAERFRQASYIVFMIFGQSILFHGSYRAAHFLNCWTDSEVERLVAAETLDRVQRFSADWHANSFVGATVTKIRRAMRAIHTFYDINCYDFFPAIGVALGLIVVIAFRQPLLSLAFAIFTIFWILLSFILVFLLVVPANRQANTHDSRLGATLADTIASNEIVKTFAGEKRESAYFEKISLDWMHIARHSWVRGNIVALIKTFLMILFKITVLGSAVWFWYKGVFSPGDVVFISASYMTLSVYLRNISDRIRDLNQAMNDMEDVVKFMNTPITVSDLPQAKKLLVKSGKIEFASVTFQYPNQRKPIFKDFSLTISAKEKVALVGHSGSGKTTFVKLLQRFYNLQRGTILIDDQDIVKVTQASLRQNIALVPQDSVLFHRSLLENIAYARPHAGREEIEKAAKQAHIDEFIRNLPNKYETPVGERGIKLSGGERQRVAIARALLADYPILILDEATSSLDSKSEKLIQDAIAHLLKNRTAIIIAHRLSTIKFVDRILVFEGGRIVEEGTHRQLLRKPDGFYRKMFQLQAGGFLGDEY